jgi:hypothetical protein
MPSLLLVKVGFVVSTLTDKTLEAELVLPSASVALAVMSVVVFSAKVTFLLKFPLSSAVVVPNELKTLNNSTVEFACALPVIVTEASVTYTLRAVDLNKFNINAESGVVTYKITPNVVPATPDNIVITATDIAGNTETHNVVITMVIKLAVKTLL